MCQGSNSTAASAWMNKHCTHQQHCTEEHGAETAGQARGFCVRPLLRWYMHRCCWTVCKATSTVCRSGWEQRRMTNRCACVPFTTSPGAQQRNQSVEPASLANATID